MASDSCVYRAADMGSKSGSNNSDNDEPPSLTTERRWSRFKEMLESIAEEVLGNLIINSKNGFPQKSSVVKELCKVCHLSPKMDKQKFFDWVWKWKKP